MGVTTKKTYEEVKTLVESKGFTLISKEYINASGELKIECPSHGVQTTTFKNFRLDGAGCPKCGCKLRNISRMIGIDIIREEFRKSGYELLSTNYENVSTPLLAKCGSHGEFKITYDSIKAGCGCSVCGYLVVGDKTRTTIEEIRKTVDKTPYTLISTEYLSHDQKLELECPQHGKFTKTLEVLNRGQGCKKCGNSTSGPQIKIFEMIKNYYLDTTCDDKDIISPLELDIYVPSRKLAIEYCGLHWHNENKKERPYHLNKLKACNEKGIYLITIFEDEWLEREDQVKNVLLAKLGLLSKLAARKCQVKEILKKESDLFMDKYHLQGSAISTLYLGLFYGDELVGAITGGPHHRQGQEGSLILNRLCFGPYAVMGGSSKLFKAFKENALLMGFNRIVSWSDNRWSTGRVYEQLGFTLEEEMGIDYSYCKSQKRISKQSCQKKNLIKKGATGNTEKEMAKSLGLTRIWDCGKKRWIFNL